MTSFAYAEEFHVYHSLLSNIYGKSMHRPPLLSRNNKRNPAKKQCRLRKTQGGGGREKVGYLMTYISSFDRNINIDTFFTLL